jgi:hypothetical protein
MLFTKGKKRGWVKFIEPVLIDRVIYPIGSVTYLGVTLDAKLTWRKHVKQRISKACSSFWLCCQSFGKKHKEVASATCGLQAEGCRPLVYRTSLEYGWVQDGWWVWCRCVCGVTPGKR